MELEQLKALAEPTAALLFSCNGCGAEAYRIKTKHYSFGRLLLGGAGA